jgi:hypothetical protein
MAMGKRKFVAAKAISLIAVSLFAGILLFDTAANKEAVSKAYSYPVLVGEKTYIITVKTNWTPEPKVDLSPENDYLKYVSVDFTGSSGKNVFFNATIPTDLLWGNITLFWKYYEQNPNRYTLSNDGTHNSVQMTFTFTPYFSGVGHFEIHGTEGAW